MKRNWYKIQFTFLVYTSYIITLFIGAQSAKFG
jgi:hypothetical protein